MKVFLMAFTQVFLVAANTVFISHGQIIGMLISSFCINWVWTHNVKKVGFGSEKDRVLYSVGATTGCLFGYYASKFFLSI